MAFCCSDVRCMGQCTYGAVSLSLCSVQQMMGGDDFKEIGVPMGPRKKLITYLRDHNQAQEVSKQCASRVPVIPCLYDEDVGG